MSYHRKVISACRTPIGGVRPAGKFVARHPTQSASRRGGLSSGYRGLQPRRHAKLQLCSVGYTIPPWYADRAVRRRTTHRRGGVRRSVSEIRSTIRIHIIRALSSEKSTNFEDFPSILRQLRLDRGMTQKELGALIGVGANTIGRWERGEGRPNSEQLQKLARALKVSVDELLGLVQIGKRGRLVVELDVPRLRKAISGAVTAASDATSKMTSALKALDSFVGRDKTSKGRKR